MSNSIIYPTPIKEIMEIKSEGRGGIILEGNTTDRLISAEKGFDTPMNMIHMVFSAFAEDDYHLGHISFTRGFNPVIPPTKKSKKNKKKSPFPCPRGVPWNDPSAFITQFIPVLESRNQKTMLILNGADLLLPEIDTPMMSQEQLRLLNVLMELGLSDSFRQSDNIIVLNALQGSVNRALLRSGAFRKISLPLPNEKMRHEFISHLGNHSKFRNTIPDDMEIDEIVRQTNGCRLIDIEGLLKKCESNQTKISHDDINKIKIESILDISQGQLGVIIPDITMDQVIGCESVKKFFEYQTALAREGNKSMPLALVFMGPPGTGKSYIIRAYAEMMKWTLIEWRNVRSQWVGQSEARTEQALDIIKQNAPVLVWVDEADQAIGQRSTNSGDGGVDARIMAMILSATGDSKLRGKVQWIFGTNRPDILDPALLDRSGAKIAFLNPSSQVREKLLPFLAGQQDRIFNEDVDFESVAQEKNLEMASVRNLIEIISQAGKYADIEKGKINCPIEIHHIERAIKDFNLGDPLEVEFIMYHTLNHLRFNDQLPWITEDGKLDPDYEIPSYLEGIVDKDTGRIDPIRLNQKLREIKSLRTTEHLMR